MGSGDKPVYKAKKQVNVHFKQPIFMFKDNLHHSQQHAGQRLLLLLLSIVLACNVAFAQTDSIASLIERARWGDANAFKELADRHCTGRGVKKDFLDAIVRAFQAEEHGGESAKDYLRQPPDDNILSLMLRYTDGHGVITPEEKDAVISSLSSSDDPDAEGMAGVLAIARGDTVLGKARLDEAASRGSDFSLLFPMIMCSEDISSRDSARLAQVAGQHPLAYMILGKMCRQSPGNGHYNRDMAAYYLMKADESGWLTAKDAAWLLQEYHKGEGSVHLSDTDVVRLTAFRDVKLKIEYPSAKESAESVNWDDTVSHYLDTAFRGDGKAYLKLARLYGGGMGMESSLTETVSMGYMAVSYGALKNTESLFARLSSKSPLNILYKMAKSAGKGDCGTARLYGSRLDSMGYHGSLFADCLTTSLEDKKGGGAFPVAQFVKAAQEGDELARACLLLYDLTAGKDTFAVQVPVEKAVDSYPVLYNILAHRAYIAGDLDQAEQYYLKAAPLLTREGAKWLLAYYDYKSRKYGTAYDEKDIEKLRKLAGTKPKKAKRYGE